MPGTVTVGCKLPNGLVLQLFRMEEQFESIANSTDKRRVDRAVLDPSWRVRLNGSARFVGKDMPHDIRHGAGLTYGVDAEKFERWMEVHKDTEFVKNGAVFAHAKSAEVTAQAKDYASELTGFERVDPSRLPAEFKGKIETADAK